MLINNETLHTMGNVLFVLVLATFFLKRLKLFLVLPMAELVQVYEILDVLFFMRKNDITIIIGVYCSIYLSHFFLSKIEYICLPMGGSAYGIPTKDTYSVPFFVSLVDPITLPICKETLGLKSSPRQQPSIASTMTIFF